MNSTYKGSWRMQNPEYPGFGRQPIQHRVFPTYKGKPVNDDELVFNTQSGISSVG
jgi:hypothetical protein